MSKVSEGPGWWMASDGRWYAPELHPGSVPPAPVPAVPDYGFSAPPPAPKEDPAASGSLASWAPSLAPPMDVPPVDAVATTPRTADSPPATAGGSSGGRVGRALRLVGIGFSMVRDEPGMLVVPVVAFVAQLAAVAVGALVAWPGIRTSEAANGGTVHFSGIDWLVAVLVGVAIMFISVMAHATVIARVMARFHGQRISNSQALRAALTKTPHLLAWAFINYVIVSILRNVANRGIVGLLVGSLVRAGWLVASFFVVPVILFEDKGALASIKRSVQLCRGRWGENIMGNSALAVVAFVAVVADIVVATVIGLAFAPLGAVVGVIGLAAVLVVVTVASAAFNAALYWFAVTGQCPGQYSLVDLQSAYRHRTRRAGALGL
jgi:hypothetical protein